MEAVARVEPAHRGFADRCVNHFTTRPYWRDSSIGRFWAYDIVKFFQRTAQYVSKIFSSCTQTRLN